MTDVWYDTWDYVVNRSDSESTVRSAFQAQGYDNVLNIENGTSETEGGWLYTVDSIPGYEGDFPEGATRVLCVETNPVDLGELWQSDPSLQPWPESSPAGTIPADVWIQQWVYNDGTFDARDKTFYVTSSDPPYPSTDYPWLALQGAGGHNFSPPPNDVDNYLALEAERAQVPYDSGSDPAGYRKMSQNLSTLAITPNTWWQIRQHFDTSGAQGIWEAWIRPRGGSWTKVAEWIGGVTTHDGGLGVETFYWPTSSNDQAGAKVMRWPSTTNGEGRHTFRYFGPLAIATSELLLPDDDSGGDSGGSEDDTTPNAFSFTDQTGVARSSTITSAAITVAGIDAAATITVTGGTYDINGSGTFVSTPGTVNNGDTVRARHTSSASYSTATHTIVTIGGVSDTFTSTTEASEIIIPAYRWFRVPRA